MQKKHLPRPGAEEKQVMKAMVAEGDPTNKLR